MNLVSCMASRVYDMFNIIEFKDKFLKIKK
jgi:hypothetical protein